MSSQLIQALQNPALYSHPVGGFQVIETHISWILLTGLYAYKIKKPVNLGFVDFSTLEKRRFYCWEEIRLNSRLAPEIYADIVSIGGSTQWPTLDVSSGAIEYAVKMVQFDSDDRLDRLLARDRLRPGHIDQLADTLAHFHGDIYTAADESDFGTADAVLQPVIDNFTQIESFITDETDRSSLAQLRQWSVAEFSRLQHSISDRKKNGHVRECHGDAHLANMVLIEGKVVLFDCLEFNANLRWIDTISELAFCTMDLADRDRPDLARRLLDRYLQRSGDYAGLMLLRFYQAYRAMVRAKVAAIRWQQLEGDASNEVYREYREYTALAERYSRKQKTILVITYGVSGGGKSTVTQALLEQLPFVSVRSDVERKRLYGLALDESSGAERASEIYGADATQRTYDRLEKLTQQILAAGYSVIVDATFLRTEERLQFHRCADSLSIPFRIVSVEASDAVMRERIRLRQDVANDASEAGLEVLDRQLALRAPLSPQELENTLAVDNNGPVSLDRVVSELKELI